MDSRIQKALKIADKERQSLLKAFPKGLVAIDLETTGLSPLLHRVIEMSAVKVTPDGIHVFDQLINPGTEIPPHNSEIHGITNDMVGDKPPIEEVMEEFKSFTGNLPLIAHNAKFDGGFLICEMHKSNADFTTSKVYCSCQFSRLTFKESPNHRLKTMVDHLSIPLENHHRALDDALACLRVFAKGLIRLEGDCESALNGSYVYNLKDFEKLDRYDIPEHLHPLVETCYQKGFYEIKYKGGSMKNKFRPIRPISFLPIPSGNVVYAHCLKTNLFKFYHFKKIKELRKLRPEEEQHWREELAKKEEKKKNEVDK